MFRRTVLLPVVVSLVAAFACSVSQPAARATTKPESITVFVTDTGKKYHLDGCRYLSHSRIAIKLEDAKRRGYTACSVCDPPA